MMFFIRRFVFVLFLYVPANCTCAENGGRRAVKAADKELWLVLEQVEGVLAVALLYRFHYQVAGVCQSAEEYKRLRR